MLISEDRPEPPSWSSELSPDFPRTPSEESILGERSVEAKTDRKRKKHAEEFKREAVRLLENRGERTIADVVAASLGVAENLLARLEAEARGALHSRSEAERGGETPEEELKRLRRENAQLREERAVLKNRSPSSRGTAREPLRADQSEKAEFPVALLCSVVGVSRSAFYAWSKGTPSGASSRTSAYWPEIRAIHVEHQERYGSPRMRAELRDRGHEVGKHPGSASDAGKRPQSATSSQVSSNDGLAAPAACCPEPARASRFSAAAPNQAWVGDITHVWTAEGLVVPRGAARPLLAPCRRLGASQVAQPRLGAVGASACLDAAQAASWAHQHTDRGCQYAEPGVPRTA